MDTFQGGILKQNEQRDKIKQKKGQKTYTEKTVIFLQCSGLYHIDTADTNVRE